MAFILILRGISVSGLRPDYSCSNCWQLMYRRLCSDKSVNKAALHVVSAHASITRVLESLDLKRMSGISPVSIDALENAFSLFCDGLTRHYLESLMPVPQGYFACLCGNFWEAYGVVRFELANVGF